MAGAAIIAIAGRPAVRRYSARMQAGKVAKSSTGFRIRRARPADIDALWNLENRVFATDRISRRGLRRLLQSASAVVLVACGPSGVDGTALVLFRANSTIARLYSLAVAPERTGQGIASALLAAVEKTAFRRGCAFVRLEVHEKNLAAINVYGKAGYRQFGRHHEYYEDSGHALRFEKRLRSA